MEGLLYNKAHPSPNCDTRNGIIPSILVLHYTAVDLDTSLFLLTDSSARRVSAHYLVPETGNPVYELVKEEDRAWHAGVSYWRGKESLNAHSIGIEIVNLGPITNKEVDITTPANSKDPAPPSNTNDEEKWNVFKEEQVEAVIKLCKIILQRHNIHPRDVVAHSDVAPTRKSDPGPMFPWKRLAENGIGLWYNPLPDDDAKRIRPPHARGPSNSWCKKALAAWGYKVGESKGEEMDLEAKSVVTAFQLRFRPSLFDGIVDFETCNILESLLIDNNVSLA